MSGQLLVLGRTGQVATELQKLALPSGFTLEAWGRDRIDLCDPAKAAALVAAHRPAVLINAAAYTLVDKAETEPLAALVINRDSPAAISRACESLGIPYIHISTDYVFDGDKPTPYVETDQRNPKNIYGRSKSEGEDAVISSGARTAIIRTSWVYAAHGANFLRSMLRLAQSHDEIRVVSDQLGRPTWANDVAATVLDIAVRARLGDDDALGVFHYSGAGDASWADFATEIFASASRRGLKSSRVKHITTAEYPTAARRPMNSRLDTSKIEQRLHIFPRDWREACDLCLSELVA